MTAKTKNDLADGTYVLGNLSSDQIGLIAGWFDVENEADGPCVSFDIPGMVIDGPVEVSIVGRTVEGNHGPHGRPLLAYRDFYSGPRLTEEREKDWVARGYRLWKVLPPITRFTVYSDTGGCLKGN